MDPRDIAGVGLFSDLNGSQLDHIASRMRSAEFPEGAYLVERDDLSYKFFVVLEGVVEVRRGGFVIAELGPGEFFGEEGILSLERRNADVVAVSPVRVAVAIGWDVRDFMDEFPSFANEILRQSANRSAKKSTT